MNHNWHKSSISLGIILIFILFPSIAKAQFDTTYVHLTKHKFSVAPLFEYYKSKMNVIKFAPDLEHLNETSGKSFSGKSNLYLGIGVSFKRLGFSLSFKLPYTDIPELKESSSMSFIGGYSYRKFYAELNFISYDGFLEKTYSLDGDNPFEESKISLHNKYSQIGGELYYFSAKKYNYDANFKNYNIQKKSAISPVGLVGIKYYKLFSSADYTDTLTEVALNRTAQVYSARLGAGLAGSLVYKERWYISAIGILGYGINRNQISGGEHKDPTISTLPSAEVNVSMGYNYHKFFVTMVYVFNNDYIYFYDNKIAVNNHFISLRFGYRFNSKFLGKAEKYL